MSGSASETKAQSLRGCKSLHVSNPGVCFRRIRSACAAGDSRCLCLTQVLRIQGAGLLEHYPAPPTRLVGGGIMKIFKNVAIPFVLLAAFLSTEPALRQTAHT